MSIFSIFRLAPPRAYQLGTNTLNLAYITLKLLKSGSTNISMLMSTNFSVLEQGINNQSNRFVRNFMTIKKLFSTNVASKLRHPYKEKWPYVLARKSYNLSLKCSMSTTATVLFAANYVPQCFNANAQYSVLFRFIIIKSMVWNKQVVWQVVQFCWWKVNILVSYWAGTISCCRCGVFLTRHMRAQLCNINRRVPHLE